MTDSALAPIWRAYGAEYGSGPLQYAKNTHYLWRHGHVKMSGEVAGRLLRLVPLALSDEERFYLIRKARERFMQKAHRRVRCTVTDWRDLVVKAVNDLLSLSSTFTIPEHISCSLVWLAGGNADAVQELLAAAEKDEAKLRIRHLRAEFNRIEAVLSSSRALKTVQHTITLPQGNIIITIHRRRDLSFRWASWWD